MNKEDFFRFPKSEPDKCFGLTEEVTLSCLSVYQFAGFGSMIGCGSEWKRVVAGVATRSIEANKQSRSQHKLKMARLIYFYAFFSWPEDPFFLNRTRPLAKGLMMWGVVVIKFL